MKIGIIGLPRSGKSIVFEALTQNIDSMAHKGEPRVGAKTVPDKRVDILSGMYNPRKTIYAQVEYFLPGKQGQKKDDQNIWHQARDCDALIHVVRNFGGYGFENPTPVTDFNALNQELIFADLVIVEKRLERLEKDAKRGKEVSKEEMALLQECRKCLEEEIPLRKHPEASTAAILKGFGFLSAKPMLILFNNIDDDENPPETDGALADERSMVIRAKLEHELAQMTEEEAAEFLAEFNITSSAMDRVINESYKLLGLISFFTVGEDEVRAWTIKEETRALDAAEVIHSDIKKGFIRAEVVSYEDLMDAGSHQEAKKKGTVRLEGKTYPVQDGDIINFRFNV